MKFNELKDLKAEIHRQIEGLMDKNCVLLNTPDHINIGDQLIWQGEMDFLKSLNIFPSYITSHFYFDWRSFSPETLILLHGGGNFGDVWEGHQDFRIKIINTYKKNRILIFPQSVQYGDEEKIIKDAEKFAVHDNVTICARDLHSYELLSKYFKNKILLVPDMAFCMNMKPILKVPSNRKLLLKRVDKEISLKFDYSKYSEFEILDWPTFKNSFESIVLRILEKLNRTFSKPFVSRKKIDTTFGLGVFRDKEYLIKMGENFIGSYDLVVSTRLHGHILALILGVPTIIIDNNYGKNNRFYNTWLKDIPASKLVTNNEELDLALDHISNTKSNK